MAREMGKPTLGVDHLAWVFLPRMMRMFMKVGFVRRRMMKRLGPSGTVSFSSARSIVFDLVYNTAMEQGVQQVAALGAGFDTRAIRFRQKAPEVAVFELDIPVSLDVKKKQLERHHVGIPETLNFIGADLEHCSLLEELAGAGFDFEKPTLFVWEGLSPYLTRATVENLLRFIKDYAAPGSRIVTDFMHTDLVTGRASGHGVDELSARMKAFNPFAFTANDDEMHDLLASIGYRITQSWGASELNEILKERELTATGPCASYMSVINAET